MCRIEEFKALMHLRLGQEDLEAEFGVWNG
jgi:hypothetical protein